MTAKLSQRIGADDDLGPSGSLVECRDVSCTFGRGRTTVAAVRRVTLEVPDGVRVALTGPSGSGKSTLLHLLAGLQAPSGGMVSWPFLDVSPQDRSGAIGMIFQGPSLVPALDVVENVALPLLLAGVEPPEATALAQEALARLDVGDLAGKLPGELSGGQAQRIAVARVLAGRPRLILADEPTGRLDRGTAGHVIDVLLATADELGAALIVATHDAPIATRLPHRWRMADGRLDLDADSGSGRPAGADGDVAR